MFSNYWPDSSLIALPSSQHAEAAIVAITDRAAALDIDIQDARAREREQEEDDSFERIQSQPNEEEEDEEEDEGPISYHDDNRDRQREDNEDDELDRARSQGVSTGMENAGHGVPVSAEDPDAYEDEPFDPLENDEWKDYKEVEYIPDPSFCWKCWATQTASEQEINQDYQDNNKLQMETLGKMSEFKAALAQQTDYNLNIRPYNPFLIDKPVSLLNFRDHASVHTINPDVIDERSLRFLCYVRRHIEVTTMRRPKKRKAGDSRYEEKLDKDKLRIWMQIDAPIKRLMTEKRRRLSSLM